MNTNQQVPNYKYQEDEIDLRDIIKVVWTRKWLIIVITVLFACIALGVSFMTAPTYVADGKIALGNTGHEMYTQAASAQQVIMSRDMMTKIIEEFDLKNAETGEYQNPENFKKNIDISTIGNTRLLQIKVTTTDPELSQGIASYIREEFVAQSQVTYLEKKKLVDELHQQYIKRYEQVGNSLDYNKEALTAIETNVDIGPAEKDLARARLIDYVTKDENTLNSLESQIRNVQVQLLDMEGANVFERASLPQSPASPNKKLNLAIGLVLGMMIGVFLAFILEYLKNNPLKLNDKE